MSQKEYYKGMNKKIVNIYITDDESNKLSKLLYKIGLSKDAYVTAIIRKSLEADMSKLELNLVDIIKEVSKIRMKGELTRSFHDQFLFKNATKTIMDLANWQNFTTKNINMAQVKMNIKKVNAIYEYLPRDLQLMMTDEKLEFAKLENKAFIVGKINTIKRIVFEVKKNAKH